MPAHTVGLEQIVEIGPLSGRANVEFWLSKRGIPFTEELINKILEYAKAQNHILIDEEVLKLIF